MRLLLVCTALVMEVVKCKGQTELLAVGPHCCSSRLLWLILPRAPDVNFFVVVLLVPTHVALVGSLDESPSKLRELKRLVSLPPTLPLAYC